MGNCNVLIVSITAKEILKAGTEGVKAVSEFGRKQDEDHTILVAEKVNPETDEFPPPRPPTPHEVPRPKLLETDHLTPFSEHDKDDIVRMKRPTKKQRCNALMAMLRI